MRTKNFAYTYSSGNAVFHAETHIKSGRKVCVQYLYMYRNACALMCDVVGKSLACDRELARLRVSHTRWSHAQQQIARDRSRSVCAVLLGPQKIRNIHAPIAIALHTHTRLSCDARELFVCMPELRCVCVCLYTEIKVPCAYTITHIGFHRHKQTHKHTSYFVYPFKSGNGFVHTLDSQSHHILL